MAKLTRVTGKVFGSQASPTGDVDNGAYIGQFGSAQAGTYVGTDDVAMIQNLPAWEQGWIGACVEEDQLPPLPERTGVDKVLSYQECYLLQQGMPEWDSATTYYIDNFCSYNGIIYKSLTDINLNNQPDTSVANWEVYGKISQYTKFAINKGNPDLLNAPGSGTVEQQWSQPTLTEDGTLGQGEFAIAASSTTTGYNFQQPYTLLNNISGGTFGFAGTAPQWITFYSQKALRVTNLQFTNYNYSGSTGKPFTSGTVQASNDNSTWTDLGSWTNSTVSAGGVWNINLTSNINYYNYYKINVTGWSSGDAATNYGNEMRLNITATELISVSTADTLFFDVDNNNPLTYTNIMGETRTVNSLLPIDVSNTNDGTFKVALPKTGNQPYLFGGTVYNQETEPLPDFQTKFTDYNFYVENNYIKLSADSIVAFPDGLNADGSKKFRYETVPYQEFTITTWSNGIDMPSIRKFGEGNFGFYTYLDNQWYCQTTQPTVLGAWYNPNTNLIKFSDDGTTWTTVDVSFPVGKTYYTNGTGFTSLIETYQTPQVLWLNPQEPYTAKLTDKVIGYGSWQDFNDTILLDSSVTVSSGIISALTQPTYNYNGIGLNQSSNTNIHDIFRKCSPDWSKGVSKSASGFTADDDGWLYIGASTQQSSNENVTLFKITINGIEYYIMGITGTSGYTIGTNTLIPLNKGDVIGLTSYVGLSHKFTFYPLKGV